MKKKVSILLLATGLFLAGATLTVKAGDEKCAAKTEKKCEGKKDASKCTKTADKKCDGKKTETKPKAETKTEAKTEAKKAE